MTVRVLSAPGDFAHGACVPRAGQVATFDVLDDGDILIMGDTFAAAFSGATWGREGDRITVDGVDRWVLDALESAP